MYRGFSIDKTSVYEFLLGDILFDDCLHDTILKKEVLHLANEFDAQFSKPAIHKNLKKYCRMNGVLTPPPFRRIGFLNGILMFLYLIHMMMRYWQKHLHGGCKRISI